MIRQASSTTRVASATTLAPRLSFAAGMRITLAVVLPFILISLMLITLDPGRLHPASAAGTIRYVAPGGSCGGATPCYGTVQAAVNAAQAGDEIRVAQGTYTDVQTIGTLTQVVYLSVSLTLRGGYATSDWANYYVTRPTILDARGLGRVIYVTSTVTATIEGFSLTGGLATNGGGLYIAGGNSLIQNNRIYGNSATGSILPDGAGGGIHVAGGSPTVQNNVIYSNTATFRGGGIHINGGAATINNNTIYSNSTTGGAGTNADGGGGIYITQSASKIRANSLYSNTTPAAGGGICVYNYNTDGAVIEQNEIYRNSSASIMGGGIFVRERTQIVQNNLIYSNTQGGGIYGNSTFSVIENNTLYGNTGNGIYLHGGAFGQYPTLRNNIIVQSSGYGVDANGAVSVTYSAVWGNTTGNFGSLVVAATGTITQNPLLTSDFRLQPGSPAIDAADPNNYPATDYAGRARPLGSRADMGAYEYYEGQCFARLNSGQVYTTVQVAIEASTRPTDVIRVAGICTGVQATPDGGQTVTQTVYISKPLTLRGGYAETYWAAPITRTILDAQGLGRVVYITGTSAITVDGFVIRGGDASAGGGSAGGGLYVAASFSPTIQNVIAYNNTATSGGGFASAGGNPRLFHNTWAANTATNGGGLYLANGAAMVRSTIVVSNAGGGIWATSGYTPNLDYNLVWGNVGGDYVAGAIAGARDISADPRFADFAGRDFHLRVDSPALHAADPSSTLNMDLEGDSRPLGRQSDIGADEATPYPNATLSGAPNSPGRGVLGQIIVYTHTLTNNGTLISDTFDLSHTLTVYGPPTNWSIEYVTLPVTLTRDESRSITVSVRVGDGISDTYAIVTLTATSRTNPNAYAQANNQTLVNWTPGVILTPVSATLHVNPGATVTVPHTLKNTGNFTDAFTITWNRIPNWTGIVVGVMPPSSVITLGPFAETTLWIQTVVTDTMPGGLTETVFLTATSTLVPGLRARLTDTFEVDFTPGPRYVATGGNNTLNNCHVSSLPCRTIAYAVDQAANGDIVKVAAGTYNEHDLTLNKTIILRGGYTTGNWQDFKPKANPTIINAQGLGRVLYIFGNPTVEGFTLQGGATAGSGGGVYVDVGEPILRQNVIISNTAGAYGGGVYNGSGAGRTVWLERNTLAFNTAQRGGGFANGSGDVRFWNNLMYRNTASAEGGGVYVLADSPLIWHNTIFSNTANRGGGLYLYGGSPMISNTLVISNSAATSTGGIYNQAAGTVAGYNDVWGNLNGNYFGLTSGPNDMVANPLFANPISYNLRLLSISPVIGRAQPSLVSDDYWGNPRPVPEGGLPDIGADEYMRAGLAIAPNYTATAQPGQVVTFTHILTNSGDYTDTVLLTASNSQGWGFILRPPPTLTLGLNMTGTITTTFMVPAGTLSNTVNTTFITATSGNDDEYWVTAINTTTIGWGLGVSLEPDRIGLMQSGDPPLVYNHTLMNVGNYTDTFNLQYRHSTTWTVALAPQVVELRGGMTTTVQVTVTPLGVSPGVLGVDILVITATSQISSSVFDLVTDTTFVNRTFSVTLEPPREGIGLPGEVVIYTHTLTNKGNYTDTFNLSSLYTYTPAFPGQSWGILLNPYQVTVGGGATRTITVTVSIPSRTLSDTAVLSGTVAWSWITATNLFTSNVRAGVMETTTVGHKVNFTLYSDTECAQAFAAQAVTVTFQNFVTNTGNYADSFAVTATSTSGYRVEVAPPTTAPLWPNTGAWVYVTVYDIPNYRTSETVIVTATSMTSNTVQRTVNDIVYLNFTRQLQWDPWSNSSTVSALGDIPAVYTHTLYYTSTELGTREVTLTAQSAPPPFGLGWPATVNPTRTLMSPGDIVPVTVTVQVPAAALDADEYTLATADILYSSCDAEIAYESTNVRRPAVLFYPDQSGSATPGSVITYMHTLSNAGGLTDSYTLTWSTPSPGWQVAVEPSLVNNLDPHTGVSVMATITVPTGLLSGTVETLVITATSHYNPVVSDTVTDQTTVAYGPGAILAPDGSGSTYPGGSYTYTHSLTNTGNYTQTYELRTNSGLVGYPVVSPTMVYSLGPGQVYTGIVVVVSIPEHAAVGAVERSQVTALFAGQQATAVDTTQVTQKPGPRYVAKGGTDGINNCSQLAQYGPCATIQHAVNVAAPGDPIYVAQGTYTGTLVLDKPVWVSGGYTLTNNWASADPFNQATILDARGQGRVISITAPVTNVTGFHILNGSASNGGGIYVDTGQPITLAALTFYSNTATQGGAIYVRSGDVTLVNSVLYSNTASSLGGGLYVTGTTRLINNTLVANRAITGGVVYQAGGSMVVTNTILISNTATITGGVAYAGPGATWSFAYNDLWNNTNAENLTSANSLAVDPLFQNVAARDFRLQADSLCIDNGITVTLSTDLANRPRPQMVAFDRSRTSDYDMGAFEFDPQRGWRFDPAFQQQRGTADTVVFMHVLTNTGNYTDTATLTATIDRAGWGVTFWPLSVTLRAGLTTTVYVTVTIPMGTEIGTVGTAIITATSDLSPSALGQVVDVTSYQQDIDVTIHKTVVPTGWLKSGDAITYTLVYTNNGPAIAYGVVITDWLPITLTNVISTSSPLVTPTVGPGYVSWTSANLSVGDKGIITLTGVVSQPTGLVSAMVNTAQITTTQYDLTPTNNTAWVSNGVDTQAPSVPILLSPANGVITSARTLTFTWQPSSDGAGAGVWGYQFVISGSAYYSSATVYSPTTWARLSYLPLGVYTWTVSAFDVLGNASAFASPFSLTIDQPVLTVTKRATPTSAVAGAPFTYLLTISNTGPVPATGVVMTDAIPTGANYVSSSGVRVGNVISWSGLSIPTGGATQATFVVSACQAVTNTSYRVVTSTEGVGSGWGAAIPMTPQAPTITANFTHSPEVNVGWPAYFTDTTNSNGSGIVGWSWNMGDGQVKTGRTISHTYTISGTYVVTLTVTDACGYMQSVTHPITATIRPGTLERLGIGPVMTQTAGVGFTLVITAYDGLGNVLTGFNGAIVLTDSTRTLSPVSWSSWSNGVATLLATITQAMVNDRITVTVQTTPTIWVTSNLFTVLPNVPASIVVSAQPSVISPTHTSNVTAIVRDQYGNPVANGTPVTFTATLGTITPYVPTINGQATTVFTGTTVGTAVITATVAPGLQGTTTVTITTGQTYIYLPVILRNYAPGRNLVVSAINTSTTPSAVSVVIRNVGDMAVTNGFYVVLYMDPTSPVTINKFWRDVGCPYGIMWGVSSLQAGESLTLTLATAYGAPHTQWPGTFSQGQHTLWAQVDAWASSGTTGLVQETNEGDNIRGPVTFTVP